eukprot:scaffold12153_cov167-Amphora_coffeaeformis.AAC.6
MLDRTRLVNEFKRVWLKRAVNAKKEVSLDEKETTKRTCAELMKLLRLRKNRLWKSSSAFLAPTYCQRDSGCTGLLL